MTDEPTIESGVDVRTYFVRGKNAMVAQADFGPLYVDYYLHLAGLGLRHAPEHDSILKDALAALTLHCASRPSRETTAWTASFQQPLLNIFVTGDSESGTVVGNLFTENVKAAPQNVFHAEVFQRRSPYRKSSVHFSGTDFFRAAEQFYERSEQRPARYFRRGPEDFVMITAQPDCDFAWLRRLDDDAVRDLDQHNDLRLLEVRRYRFACGCTQARLMNALAPVMKSDPTELFGDSEIITVTCPRCGARHRITREMLEAWRAEHKNA